MIRVCRPNICAPLEKKNKHTHRVEIREKKHPPHSPVSVLWGTLNFEDTSLVNFLERLAMQSRCHWWQSFNGFFRRHLLIVRDSSMMETAILLVENPAYHLLKARLLKMMFFFVPKVGDVFPWRVNHTKSIFLQSYQSLFLFQIRYHLSHILKT